MRISRWVLLIIGLWGSRKASVEVGDGGWGFGSFDWLICLVGSCSGMIKDGYLRLFTPCFGDN